VRELACREGEMLGLTPSGSVIDAYVTRCLKAYPVYDERYKSNVGRIRAALTEISNLQVIGRNGMHKYNNQDHSMLTGILAARNVVRAGFDVWAVNVDAEYIEEPTERQTGRLVPELIKAEPAYTQP